MKVEKRGRLGVEGWRAALKRYGESGLSVREFCEREGLGSVSFYQWRARLSAKRHRTEAVKAPPPPTSAAGFLDLGNLSASAGRRMEVRLELGGAVVLHLVRS